MSPANNNQPPTIDDVKMPPQEDDEAEEMPEWARRWIMTPVIIAIAAVFAVGLLAASAGFGDILPQWAYSMPAVPALLGYYVIELRKLWREYIGEESATGGESSSSANASSVVRGNHNQVTIISSSANEDHSGRKKRRV